MEDRVKVARLICQERIQRRTAEEIMYLLVLETQEFVQRAVKEIGGDLVTCASM